MHFGGTGRVCGGFLKTEPAEFAALEADAIVAAITFENTYTRGTSFAAVAVVKLEAALEELFFVG